MGKKTNGSSDESTLDLPDWRAYPLPASVVLALIWGYIWVDSRYVVAADFVEIQESQQVQITDIRIEQLTLRRNYLQDAQFNLEVRLRTVENIHPEDERRLKALKREIKDTENKIRALQAAMVSPK